MKATRLSTLSVPSLHAFFSLSSCSLHRSRLPILVILLGLVLSPLVTFGALQPSLVAAQESPTSQTSAVDYNSSVGPVFTLPQWADGSGWDNAGYYATIQLSDINGDGADEMLARGASGMIVERWDANLGLWKTVSTNGPFSDAAGWNHPQYYETIQTGDIDGDGSAELLGRSSVGINTYKWNWDETTQTGTWSQLAANVPAFSDKEGWDNARFYSTIQTADIDGDGADELLARSTAGIDTYKWANSTWTLLKAASPAWSDPAWKDADTYSTIQTADIDGDGKAELLGRSKTGLETYEWDGSAWKQLDNSGIFTNKAGWNEEQYYATIQTGDIDGDGKADLLSRAYRGMIGYSWTGSGWKALGPVLTAWGTLKGWDAADTYLTIQTGDVDGDGAVELLGRSSEGMETYKWESGNWTSLAAANPHLTNDHWKGAKNYLTIQNGDIDGDKAADLVARGLYGVRTWSYNKVTANEWNHPTAYGFTAFTGDQEQAYDFVSTFLTIQTGQTIRGQYTTDASTLGQYQKCLYSGTNDNEWNDWPTLPSTTCASLGSATPITPPSGLTLVAWNTVAEQIWEELGLVQSVRDYFNDLTALYTGIYSDEKNILDSTAETLYNEDMSEKKVDAIFEDLFLTPFKLAPLGGPVSAAIGGTLSALISAGLSAAGSDSFEGKLSEAQTKFTELTEKNKDEITNARSFVAGDLGLLTYVANQKTSGNWDPADAWVTRYLTSEGRKNFALWIYQTLSPSVWKLISYSWLYNSECSDSGDDRIYEYYVGDNNRGDCSRDIVKDDILEEHAPDKQLHNIMDAVTSSCTPTMSNTSTWEYGSCSLGVERKDFFLNRDGWKFRVELQCVNCAPPPDGMDIALGDPSNTIDLNHPGSVEVAILGSADFDASSITIKSLEFAGAAPVGWWSDDDVWHPSRIKDVDGDGYLDVVATFEIADLQLTEADTVAVLRGSSETTRFTLEAPVTVLPAR